jgi:hypothetical protein
VPFTPFENLQNIDKPERDHLQALDAAISQALSASAAAASRKNLDQELIAKATVTLLMTVSARKAVDVSKTFKEPVRIVKFASLAKDALLWAQRRLF